MVEEKRSPLAQRKTLATLGWSPKGVGETLEP